MKSVSGCATHLVVFGEGDMMRLVSCALVGAGGGVCLVS